MLENIQDLINEWLETLDDDEDYWDGLYASDKTIAGKYMQQFIAWLKAREAEKETWIDYGKSHRIVGGIRKS